MEGTQGAPQAANAEALALLERARLARQQGRLEEAEQACRRAVELAPRSGEARWKLGAIQRERGHPEAAETTLRAAVAIAPDNLEALLNLATTLCALERPGEALEFVARAAEVAPGAAIVHANAGFTLAQCGREQEAVQAYARAVELRPDYAEARWNMAQLLLGLGRYAEGWPLFEARWQLTKYARQRPAVGFPQWAGEDLRGKRLFVHSEQGFGDTMQFLRYVELAAERGAEVVLHVRPELRNIAASVRGVARLGILGEPVPECDYACAVMSLARGFGTTVETIPRNVPYFAAPDAAVAAWRRRLEPDAALNVGLVWASGISSSLGKGFVESAVARSLPLATLAGLGSVQGARFYSLQKGPPAAEALAPPAGLRLRDWAAELRDFIDTAALIRALDLVITVDTSIAHLAGALGKPVWVLVNVPSSWRWLRERDDSPWYPTMRLFRQSMPGAWQAPVEAMRAALAELVARGARPRGGLLARLRAVIWPKR
jgi:Tfp pilus assembly protein PilF